MKLVKGSKAAKDYMASIRAKKKVAGLDKVIRKGKKTNVHYTRVSGLVPKKNKLANDPVTYYTHEIRVHDKKRSEASELYIKFTAAAKNTKIRAQKLEYNRYAREYKLLVNYHSKQINSLKSKIK